MEPSLDGPCSWVHAVLGGNILRFIPQEPGSFITASSLFKDVNLNLRFCYDPPPGPPQELEEHRMD
ncbi:Hypothetical predicted protein [Marmota monax]|uniref:Uncharacterized protein n=1 Tax=Marmota monax TaxID=9995 RepID=A0A5E4CSP5_MARMO|nr:hypothetical protein GHT09_014293 [Marmota monax]VTJ84825.1 Hypothetical predicted protein [Marmota monax]